MWILPTFKRRRITLNPNKSRRALFYIGVGRFRILGGGVRFKILGGGSKGGKFPAGT